MTDKLSFMTEDVKRLHQLHPLVHCITNQVSMDWTANLLLAVGVSPLMSSAKQEVIDISQSAEALLINIGTADDNQLETMLTAGAVYQQRQRPIVLDPVGIGISQYRRQCVKAILDVCTPTIIRGNASEIAVLAGISSDCRGVDSTMDSAAVAAAAERKARELGCVIVISGATDYITDGYRTEQITQGTPMMTRVTAMGCGESALMTAMAAVQPDAMRAAYSTMLLMAMTGEKSAMQAQGPGSFRQIFLDRIYETAHMAAAQYTGGQTL